MHVRGSFRRVVCGDGRVVGVFVAGRGVWGESGCVAVLVDESVTAGVSSDRLAGSMLDDDGVGGCVLFERPVGTVGVVVLDVVA